LDENLEDVRNEAIYVIRQTCSKKTDDNVEYTYDLISEFNMYNDLELNAVLSIVKTTFFSLILAISVNFYAQVPFSLNLSLGWENLDFEPSAEHDQENPKNIPESDGSSADSRDRSHRRLDGEGLGGESERTE
jgi:hypothetical protein